MASLIHCSIESDASAVPLARVSPVPGLYSGDGRCSDSYMPLQLSYVPNHTCDEHAHAYSRLRAAGMELLVRSLCPAAALLLYDSIPELLCPGCPHTSGPLHSELSAAISGFSVGRGELTRELMLELTDVK